MFAIVALLASLAAAEVMVRLAGISPGGLASVDEEGFQTLPGLFEPGQQSLLHNHIIAPEGRVHFAGEHASLAHAWIQGAIESGLRAAGEVNAAR